MRPPLQSASLPQPAGAPCRATRAPGQAAITAAHDQPRIASRTIAGRPVGYPMPGPTLAKCHRSANAAGPSSLWQLAGKSLRQLLEITPRLLEDFRILVRIHANAVFAHGVGRHRSDWE